MSRGLFILVHISSPMACRGLWLSGERAEIAALALAHWAPPLPLPPLRFVTKTRTSSSSDSDAHAATRSYHEEGSESMVVCLQREEEEHRLQEKHKETVELLNGPDAIKTRRNRFIGVGIQSENSKVLPRKCQRSSTLQL